MLVADSVPSAHDCSHGKVRDIPRLPDNKSKTQLCHTSNKEPVAEVQVISLDAWEKGQQPLLFELVFLFPLPINGQQTSMSSSPVAWVKQKTQAHCLDTPGTQLPWLC